MIRRMMLNSISNPMQMGGGGCNLITEIINAPESTTVTNGTFVIVNDDTTLDFIDDNCWFYLYNNKTSSYVNVKFDGVLGLIEFTSYGPNPISSDNQSVNIHPDY